MKGEESDLGAGLEWNSFLECNGWWECVTKMRFWIGFLEWVGSGGMMKHPSNSVFNASRRQ
jgi:hypothetical protein